MRERIEFLYPAERAMMTADAAGLTQDADIALPITYTQLNGTTFTPSTGVEVDSTTVYSVTGLMSMIPVGEVKASQGLYQMGDVNLVIARSILPITPNKEDKLTFDGTDYSIVNFDSDPAKLLWRIVARRMT
jgi:hypothetical protein